MNETEIRMYESVCRHDGIKARKIAREIGVDKTEINRLLYHSPFIRDLCFRNVMMNLFRDLDLPDISSWEICFELRIKRAKWIRIYADVLVITNDKVFSLEFKMKDKADPEERGKEFD